MNTSAQSFDVDLMLDPKEHSLGFIADMNRLRECEPIHWSEKSKCWIVSGYQDVKDGFAGVYPLANAGRNEFSLVNIPLQDRPESIPNLHKYIKHWIVSMDPPEHTRLRRLVMMAFTKRLVEKVRTYARERVNQRLDKAAASDTIEVNEEIARPIPGYVIFKLLGIPDEHFGALRDWSNAVIEGMTSSAPPPDILAKSDWALGEMNKVVLAELKKREHDPKEDLITSLLQATEDGESLTIDELLGTMHVAIVAGHDTTANTMTLGIEALSRHPEAWQYMYEHPDEMLACVNELMRYVAMSGGQPRIASDDFDWHDKKIKKGDIVFLSIVGANRDPTAFPDPEKLDFSRDNTNSLVFAPGLHHCIGHLLAKMQLVEFFQALVTRFESVEILEKELRFMPAGIFRGMYGMNARFQERRPV